jgi:hypothetical protein
MGLFSSFICRRVLDKEKGNPWICLCPICKEAKGSEENERLLHSDRVSGSLQIESKDDLSPFMGEGDTGL